MRRVFFWVGTMFLATILDPSTALGQAGSARIPVILDTDINADLDDTWAFVQTLKNPRYDIKLITTTSYNAVERARLMAKLLTIAGRTDIPIALGDRKVTFAKGGSQSEWLGNYQLADYKGKVLDDAPKAIVDFVNNAPVPLTIIAIGPLQTVAEALGKDPSIASKSNIVCMNGNIALLRDKATNEIRPEGNTKNAVKETRLVFAAPWRSIIIAPLDTAIVRIGKRDKQLLDHSPQDPLLRALMECTDAFVRRNHPDLGGFLPDGTRKFGQVLFDSVAVYLADPDPQIRKFIEIKLLKIKITDDGKTLVDPEGNEIQVAISWKDREAYLDYLANILMSPTLVFPQGVSKD